MFTIFSDFLPHLIEVQKSLQRMNELITSFFEAIPKYSDLISSSDDFEKYVQFGELLTEEFERYIKNVIIFIILHVFPFIKLYRGK